MKIIRLKNTDADFQILVNLLDLELTERYGELQFTYDNFNKIEPLSTALTGYIAETPIACGCFKPFESNSIEIKRMFVKKDFRRNGYSTKILERLENWGREIGYQYAVLETGSAQLESIGLYKKMGYEVIPNYGPYINMPNSICMKKKINQPAGHYPEN